MKHQWLKYYNVYINHDSVVTLIYFTTRFNGVYNRSQVSVYRTIGPLVSLVILVCLTNHVIKDGRISKARKSYHLKTMRNQAIKCADGLYGN